MADRGGRGWIATVLCKSSPVVGAARTLSRGQGSREARHGLGHLGGSLHREIVAAVHPRHLRT
jgi:hypothetical protein